MILKDNLILYHGSYVEIENVDLTMCDEVKDFGRGFYLTKSKKQAASFIKTSLVKAKQKGRAPKNQCYGYVTVYKVHLDTDVKIYEFDKASMEWLYYISMNRRSVLKDKLKGLLVSDIEACEVIIGKIANDDTNATLNAYLAGTFGTVGENSSFKVVSSLLKPERLEEQFCFKTEASLRMLEKIGVEKYEIGQD